MGFAVTSLHRAPQAGFDWYVYVVGGDAETKSAIDGQLANFGFAIGPAAAFITGTDKYNKELFDLLSKGYGEGMNLFMDLFHSTPCLILSDGSLLKTVNPVHVLPIPSLRPDAKHAVAVLGKLIELIANAIATGSLPQLFENLGAKRIDLAALPGGVVVATLAKLNDIVKLEPNMFGIGVNLNRIVSGWLSSRQRT